MIRAVQKFAFLFLVLLDFFSFALESVRFGPEFTFMQDDKSIGASSIVDSWKFHLIQNQSEFAKFEMLTSGFEDRVQFNSPNGWYFFYCWDSKGIEVGMNPMTVAQYRLFASDINDAIFVTAASRGYFPALWQGGGHINIDMSVFRDNPLLFRNFIVDLLNHAELYMGILNYDSHNALPMQTDFLFNSRLAENLKLIDSYAGGPLYTTKEMIQIFRHGIVSMGNSFSLHKIDEGYPERSRIEIRAVRPQASLDVFIRQIDLIEHRLQYLERIKHPIPYKAKVAIIHVADEYTPPVDPQLALRAYHEYVTESGLQWKDHRDYLWPQWTTGGELMKFEEGWLKQHELNVECKSLLANVTPLKRRRH